MRRIAVTNQKGGSGKTTTAVNVAAALGEAGRRVLLIDLDPQASASTWLGVKDGGRGLLDVFTEGRALASLVQPTEAPGVDVIPSSAWLVGVDKALAGEVGAETILRRALDGLPQRWDAVVVDCPPSLGLLAVSALAGCPEVLVPVETRVMALAGLAALVQTVERVRDRLNPGLRLAGLLACRFDTRTRLSQDIVSTLRERFAGDVFQTVIRENVRLAEAPSFGKPITLYDPRSAGAEDYRSAAVELAARWRKDTQSTKQRQQTKGKR
jgi:chromosome partitioning protein